MLIQPFHLQI